VTAVALDAALVALSHPARRELVRLCVDEERTAGELGALVRLRQPTTSQHLRILRDAGLLVVRRDGNRRFYRVDFVRLATIHAALDALWGAHLPELKRAAEELARDSAPARRRSRTPGDQRPRGRRGP
jgi:DNA-binding transcriptional ArsR family regulator